MQPNYDIILSGVGRLGIKTLDTLIENLRAQKEKLADKTVRIALIHDSDVLGGSGYSPKTSFIPLQFHQACYAIEEVMPGDQKNAFEKWLDQNIDKALYYIEKEGGEAGKKWLERHGEAYRRGDYGERRMPRAIYGLYLHEMVFNAIEQSGLKNVEVDLLMARATNPRRGDNGGYDIDLVEGKATRMKILEVKERGFIFHHTKTLEAVQFEGPLNGRQVLWAPGGMPTPDHPKVRDNEHYFGFLYDPERNLADVEMAIRKKFAELNSIHSSDKPIPVDVVVGGSGPSAMDFLALLHYKPELQEMVNITVLAGRSGPRPVAVSSDTPKEYAPQFISDAAIDTAEKLVAAIKKEFDTAWKNGKGEYTQAEVAKPLWPAMLETLATLPHEEQFMFRDQAIFPLYFDYFAFDAVEVVEAVEVLRNKNKVTFINGHMDHDSVEFRDGRFHLKYRNVERTGLITRPLEEEYTQLLAGHIFLNAMGGVGQDFTRNNNQDRNKNFTIDLRGNGLAQYNVFRRGLETNEHFELVTDSDVTTGFHMAGYGVHKSIGPGGLPHVLAGMGHHVDFAGKTIGAIMAERAINQQIDRGQKTSDGSPLGIIRDLLKDGTSTSYNRQTGTITIRMHEKNNAAVQQRVAGLSGSHEGIQILQARAGNDKIGVQPLCFIKITDATLRQQLANTLDKSQGTSIISV